ncbi:hypothetical protein SAMN05443637_12663 [Pseudonocardia thermophila]|jgi:hypothetical protein|uniref:DUF4333 domain-containing protein n=1 Tax=Pseudonocardia thermophila TaxID=1848 RepID=A0A1M7A7P8_PSETH|nr:hypothetical protein [Pseudonocardia thermophila]SHL38695.1 hypothetical protein SAMN05443637_12663 [Pseudonocardia thermophila]
MTRTIVYRAAVAAVLAAALAACGAAPAAVALADACTDANDDRAVVLEGTLAARSTVACNDYDGTYRCMLDITGGPGERVGIDIAVGSGGSTMDELGNGFSAADVHVRAEDGSPLGVGQKLRVTGEMSVAGQDVCFVTADRIDRA